MTVKQLIDRLIRLPIKFQNCRILVNVPQLRAGDEGPCDIETLVIDQKDIEEPEILIEVK